MILEQHNANHSEDGNNDITLLVFETGKPSYMTIKLSRQNKRRKRKDEIPQNIMQSFPQSNKAAKAPAPVAC